jgi:predicted O-linked N-acetylglucosamine transferase (SPINDLY family)
VFLPVHAHEAYLGGIARAALVLDSPGFSGGATSLDAFSVGVPVLAWQGTMARGRQTMGMLATMGIEGLTATGADDYVDKAVALLASAPRRDALRAQIHERKHVLFEHAGVIAAFGKFIEEAVAAAAQRA